ncbi:MAG: hypothetical protein AAF717_06485 [Bacteroidota bacterium]
MKRYLFLFIFGFFFGCNDDEGDDCELVDCAFQSMSIEFVDTDGTNLIANGTYEQATIIVTKNGVQLNSNLSTSDTLFFEINGEVGENIYEIKLTDAETDMLILNLSGENVQTGCCGPYFPITQILYNNQEQEGESDEGLYFERITIVKLR